MRLADVLREDDIFLDLKAGAKAGILEEMASGFSGRAGLDGKKVLDALMDREKLGTTAIGHGVAVPHGKIKGLHEIRVCFGRSKKGVDFDSMDKMPVHLLFMIIVPENSAAAHLKVLAGISHLLKDQDFRTRLMRAEGRSEVYRAIVDGENERGSAGYLKSL